MTAHGKQNMQAIKSPMMLPSIEYVSRNCLRQNTRTGGNTAHKMRFTENAASRSLHPQLLHMRTKIPWRIPHVACPLLRSSAFLAGIRGIKAPHSTVLLSIVSKSSQKLNRPVLHAMLAVSFQQLPAAWNFTLWLMQRASGCRSFCRLFPTAVLLCVSSLFVTFPLDYYRAQGVGSSPAARNSIRTKFFVCDWRPHRSFEQTEVAKYHSLRRNLDMRRVLCVLSLAAAALLPGPTGFQMSWCFCGGKTARLFVFSPGVCQPRKLTCTA